MGTLSARQEIAQIAANMLASEIGLLEGCREIVRLRGNLPTEDMSDALLLGIVGIESDTDDRPLGPERSVWAPEALAKVDARKEGYIARVRDGLLQDCRELVARWG